jgi:hypothetical protein
MEGMGPWFVRDQERPFGPGISLLAMRGLIEEGRVSRYTIVRGPTTRQLWTVARHAPGLAHLLGYCHACDAPVLPDDEGCGHCGASFLAGGGRDPLGLEEPTEDLAVTPGRSVGFVPPPPRGLSAFGSDEEILDPALRAPRSARANAASATAEPGWPGTGAIGQPAPSVAGEHREAARHPTEPAVARGIAGAAVSAGVIQSSIERSLRSALRRQRVASAALGAVLISVLMLALWVALAAPERIGVLLGRAGGAERTGPDATADQAEPPSQAQPPVPNEPGGLEGVRGPDQDNLESLERALDELAADRRGDPDARRRAWSDLDARLTRLASASGEAAATAAGALRIRLQELRAQIELDAVLPPEEAAESGQEQPSSL